MTDIETRCSKCDPKCGGARFENGNLVRNAPLRFKRSNEGSFRRGWQTAASACMTCGRIDLYIEEMRH